MQLSLCLSIWPAFSLHPRAENLNWFVFKIAFAKIMEKPPSALIVQIEVKYVHAGRLCRPSTGCPAPGQRMPSQCCGGGTASLETERASLCEALELLIKIHFSGVSLAIFHLFFPIFCPSSPPPPSFEGWVIFLFWLGNVFPQAGSV